MSLEEVPPVPHAVSTATSAPPRHLSPPRSSSGGSATTDDGCFGARGAAKRNDGGESSGSGVANNVWRWMTVQTSPTSLGAPPCLRSLHVGSVMKGKMYVFGGYDGSNRVNDFHEFDFKAREWRLVPPVGQLPAPRDRHVSVVYGNSFYVFAGFDGATRVNDFYEYSFDHGQWAPVAVARGGVAPVNGVVQQPASSTPPSPRHSHSAVIYGHSMYVFGGYDGSYRSDFHAFNFTTMAWSQVASSGRVPRCVCIVESDPAAPFRVDSRRAALDRF